MPETDSVLETSFDPVFNHVILNIDKEEFLGIQWEDWAYPNEGVYAAPRYRYFLWIIRTDTSYTLANLDGRDLPVMGSNSDYPALYNPLETGYSLLQYSPKTQSLGYEVESRWEYILVNQSTSASDIKSEYFKYAQSYSDGWMFASPKSDSKWWAWAYNNKLEPVHGPYLQHGRASEGLMAVIDIENDKYRYVDYDGENAFEGRYDMAGDFHEGRALVRNGNRQYYIDREGKEVFSGFFEGTDFFEGGAAAIKKDDGWILVDTMGQRIGNYTFDNVLSPGEALLPVSRKGKWYHINYQGRMLNTQGYRFVSTFRGGFAYIWDGDYKYPEIHLINKEGEAVYQVYSSDEYRQMLASIKRR